jgi:nucleotide-binding universal stress UspA family protein
VKELVSLFQKVLVPVDGSRNAARALDAAITMAKKFKGKIVLLHVYSIGILTTTLASEDEGSILPGTYNSLLPSKFYKATKEAIRRTSITLLNQYEEMVKAKGISVEKILLEGHIVQEILKTAKKGKCDLIVMGAKGTSDLKETLLGSVSEKVIRNVKCPILVIN